MKKNFILFVLSVLSTCGLYAQYVAPSEGVFRIVNVEYGAVISENFVSGNLQCAAVGDSEDYEQMWILKPSGSHYTIQNVFTGRYIQTGNSGTEVPYWTGVAAKQFSIVKSNQWEGYNIWDTGLAAGQGLHSKGADGNVVRWGSESAKAASEWQFEPVEVTEEQIAAAQSQFAELAVLSENGAAYELALAEVFEDAACTVLKADYAAMEDEALRASLAAMGLPATLVEMALKVKNDTWGEANEKADKPAWASEYAKKFRVQLIEPYSIAGEITSWFGYNAHTNMDNPTGIYGNGREVVYIMVEGEIKEGSELWATWINGHSKMPNYSNGYSNGVRLKSGLNVVPFGADGSAIYLNYLVHTYDAANHKFPHKLSEYDDLKVHIEGGYINGYYNAHGDALYTADTDADWEYYEERANLRNITVLGRHQILQFELNDVTITETNEETGKTSTWTEKGLAKLFPDMLPADLPANQRINAIVEAWDRVMLSEMMTLGVVGKEVVDSMNQLYPRYDASRESTAEMYDYNGYAEFCDGRDYSEYYNHHGLAFGTISGYMYGSWDHCGYHINTTPSILTQIATESGPVWGPAHEIGHQHQGLFTVNGLTEVTNNLFSNIAVWYMGFGTSRVNGTEGNLAHVYDNFKAGGDFFGNNIWALTQMYYRLWLYYHLAGNNTQFYPRLFELLRETRLSGGYYQQGRTSILRFYQHCCDAAQEDLTEFFRAYGFFRVMTNRLVGDYSNSEYTQTQADIDAAIAAIKAKGYPVNNKALFINDCTPDTTYSHDGKTPRSYWDGETKNGQNGEVGSYISYVASDTISGQYIYTLSGNRITFSGGKGAVGFAAYNEKNEILAFSNNHSFTVTDNVLSLLRGGRLRLVAVVAEGEDVRAKSVAEAGTEAEQLNILKKSIYAVQAALKLSDDKGMYVGYYKKSSLPELEALLAEAQAAIKGKDTSLHSYGEWSMLLDAMVESLKADASVKVPMYAGSHYALGSVKNNRKYLDYASAGLTVMTSASLPTSDTGKHWTFVSSGSDNRYYLQNVSTGKYVSVLRDGESVKAEATSTSSAVVFELRDEGDGKYLIKKSESNVWLACDDDKKSVIGSSTDAASLWTITLIADHHTAAVKDELEHLLDMVASTLELLVETTEPELKLYDDVTIMDGQLLGYVETLQDLYVETRKAVDEGAAYLEDYYAQLNAAYKNVVAGYRKPLEVSEGSEVMCYYLQCLKKKPSTEADKDPESYLEKGLYAYHFEGTGRKGAIRTGSLTDVADHNYWFYLRAGETEGEYYIYNWQTGKAVGVASDGKFLYTDGSVEPESYVISSSEETFGFTISTSGRVWGVQPVDKGYAQMSITPATWNFVPIGKYDTTGIVPVERPVQYNNVYYDLMGRPVDNPTKGIYIFNGRKVVVK